CQQYFSYPYSF
nr:immunoglobulin light chain junction region [Macaca mulatta]MOW74280.1 immunoglobulin light chain junction region [Macaca mulatta]MOW74649.1 immunoglobulin light chain junction region [Macaca mulatta]